MVIPFGGLDNSAGSLKDAKTVILPVSYGRTVSYRKGTEKGPSAILSASANLELFDEELDEEVCSIGIATMPLVEVNSLKSKEMINVLKDKVSRLIKHNKLPVIIGGEHSVTIPVVSAIKKKYNDLSILYFDAHYDLKNEYNGTKYSHACVARRLIEITQVVEVGVRSLSKEERMFLRGKNIKVVTMSEVIQNRSWYKDIKDYLSEDVYISIDLDVFDPSIMPSVGNPEPSGMKWREFLEASRTIIDGKNIVGFDVVELSPIRDMISPDFMAARLIYKMLGYIFFRGR